MSDNIAVTPGTGAIAAADEAPYSGDTTKIQIVKLVFVTGTEGSKVVAVVPGDATDGLLVNLGSNNSVAPQQIVATTGIVTRVASSATTVQMLAANTSRAGCIIHINSTADAYIKYGTTADIAGGDESYTYHIPAGAVWEMAGVPYTGRIDIIWASANGYAMVTELI